MQLYNFAADESIGEVSFYEAGFLAGSFIWLDASEIPNNKAVIKVRMTTIDALVLGQSMKNVKLIKIDVEGFELDVLKGALNTIATHDPVFLSEFNSFAIGVNRKFSPYVFLEQLMQLFGRFYGYRSGKSFCIENGSDEVETQGKSLSAIALLLTQDPKHLQLAKNMFNQNPLSSQHTIFLLPPFRQRMIFGFLERRLAIFVKFCQALVARIRQNSNVLWNVEFLVLEKLEVMFATLAKGGLHNFSRLLVGNQLRFLSVSLLFAAVVRFLAFFGCSTGCSLTSISTTSKIVSLGCRAFLPGKRNGFERTRASSTLWRVRQTVASLIP